jgi:uncharacterized protein YkwD
MRSPLLCFLLALTFCSAAFAQSAANNATLSGAARNRFAADNGTVRVRGPEAAPEIERQVFNLLNAERRSKGLLELEWNDDVAAVARLHSHNMADGKFFSHRGTDGSMVDDRADRLGLGTWRVIGENIAYMRGYENPAALAVEKWMESTAHRKNLLGPNWKESAVGVAITEDGTYYMTQVFLLRK